MKKLIPLISLTILALCAVFPWTSQATTASLLGVYNTDNVPALTFGYCDQFGVCNGGQVTFNGSTSGATILKPAAAAGSGTVTLPTLTGTLLATGNPVDTSGIAFSTSLSGNPLELFHFDDVTVAQASVTKIILASSSGRTIYPGNMTIMASGSLTGATGIKILCFPSLRLIGTFNAGALITNVPVGLFSSGVTAASGGSSCAANDSVQVSSFGSAPAGSTDFFVSFPYTVQ